MATWQKKRLHSVVSGVFFTAIYCSLLPDSDLSPYNSRQLEISKTTIWHKENSILEKRDQSIRS